MAEYIRHKAKYIDINKVTIPRSFFNQDLNVPKLLEWLDSQPAADVVEVVRCKDCIYAFMTIGKEQVKYCDMFNSDDGVFFDKNHFCSYGVRKEGAVND